MQRTELLRRAKLISYNVSVAVLFAESFDASCFSAFEADGLAPAMHAKQNVGSSTSITLYSYLFLSIDS